MGTTNEERRTTEGSSELLTFLDGRPHMRVSPGSIYQLPPYGLGSLRSPDGSSNLTDISVSQARFLADELIAGQNVWSNKGVPSWNKQGGFEHRAYRFRLEDGHPKALAAIEMRRPVRDAMLPMAEYELPILHWLGFVGAMKEVHYTPDALDTLSSIVLARMVKVDAKGPQNIDGTGVK